MGNPAHVPQLQEYPAAGSVHAVGDPSPTGDMGLGVNARRTDPTDRPARHGRRLGYDEPGSRALAVVLSHEAVGRAVGIGTASGHGAMTMRFGSVRRPSGYGLNKGF